MVKRFLLMFCAFVFSFGTIFSLMFSPTAYAEDDTTKPAVWLQISPVSNRVALNANEALSYVLKVSNIGSETFKFKVYAKPYSVENESYEVNFNNETARTQISRWITFNQNESAKSDAEKDWKTEATYSIDPGVEKTIEYKVTVPADIPDGGQYATIFAESLPDTSSDTTGIRTVSRVGMVLFGHTNGDTEEKATIENFNLKTFMTSGKVSSSASVVNNGNTDFTASYSLVVKKFFGNTAYENSKTYDVLPETSRNISATWDETPILGIFHVTTKVQALDQNYETTRIVLIIPMFIIIIMVILLTIIIVWLIILIKKRRTEKSRLIV